MMVKNETKFVTHVFSPPASYGEFAEFKEIKFRTRPCRLVDGNSWLDPETVENKFWRAITKQSRSLGHGSPKGFCIKSDSSGREYALVYGGVPPAGKWSMEVSYS